MPPQTIAATEVTPRPARIRPASPPEADPAPSVSPPPPAAESVAPSESPKYMTDEEIFAIAEEMSAKLGRPLRTEIEWPLSDDDFEELAVARTVDMIRNPSSRISHEQFWREIDEDRERRDREESASGDAD